MNFNELFQLYKQQDSESTVRNYTSIIKNYMEYMGSDSDAEIGLTSNKTKNFILNVGGNKTNQKYEAIRNLYNFYYDKVKKVIGSERIRFPIEKRELPVELKGNTKKKQTSFLSKNFMLSKFLDDSYYEHLHNENISLMAKAAIGLTIATGYPGGFINPSSKTKSKKVLSVNDVQFIDGKCRVPHYYKENHNIYIDGKIKDILVEYIKVRNAVEITKSGQEDDFIAELESFSRFDFDDRVDDKKPYGKHQIINYVLKYICMQNGEEPITIDHLRYNVVFHSLIQSKGTSLNEIIELFGIEENFVVEAIHHYHNETFKSELNKPVYVINSKEPEDEPVPPTTLLEKLVRDRDKKKVHELKELYDYKCQICNEQITLIDSLKYCEVHHIRPLGNNHNGPDETYNMVVVCPNHHTLFDLGVLTIDPEDSKSILHVDVNNTLNQQEITLKHTIDEHSLRYAYSNIFLINELLK
ncbi:HNH endonuclease [Ureibacillus manganicus]|uniref:Core-binding (CB) domain-containing protein n=1 Tax=Ureibacillus manganicus DSM 26584 TaxID=1384049 RepID=A0A0A3HMM5_9BACL|nr:HNH endonuclease [Ureibacillus manganicus]KGR73639.1 hypothetical protein CD29_19270 [Ureibacillus manganicus DSM 26584]